MINNKIALVIDSTSKYSDVWIPYFGELKRFFPNEIKKYLCTDVINVDLDVENMIPLYYNNEDSYRNQFLNCLKRVEEKYIIYNSEDYILYNVVDIEEIQLLVDILENDTDYDFVKFIKGPELTTKYSDDYPNLHIIDKKYNLFAQQASLWKTESLIKVFENSLPENGRMQQEPMGSEVCRRIGIGGLQHHIGFEMKRGGHHWDSIIFPCTATAVCKGKWNTGEYDDKLEPLFRKYNIDPKKRGVNK